MKLDKVKKIFLKIQKKMHGVSFDSSDDMEKFIRWFWTSEDISKFAELLCDIRSDGKKWNVYRNITKIKNKKLDEEIERDRRIRALIEEGIRSERYDFH